MRLIIAKTKQEVETTSLPRYVAEEAVVVAKMTDKVIEIVETVQPLPESEKLNKRFDELESDWTQPAGVEIFNEFYRT